ncbi:MAG: branched-chain amino acid ABC transporter permease [Actinomycetota bacterium]
MRDRRRTPELRLGSLGAFAPIGAAAFVLALVPLWAGDSRSMMTVVTTGLTFASYAVAFNLIFGATGQLFLCVGALAGIGGFGSVIASDRLGLPFLVTMPMAALLSGVFGAALSWVAVRRSLDTIFTGIVTLAFALSFQSFVLGQPELTGGENGIQVAGGTDTLLRQPVEPYYVFLGLLVAFLVIYRIIQRSHVGWAFRALRDDDAAAALAGIDVARYRILAGWIGSMMLGLTGALFAHYRGFVGDTTYAFGSVDVRVLVMLAFGGIGTLLGPVLGATVFTIMDELLVDQAQVRELIYGVITVVLFLSFRQGPVPALTNAVRRRVGSDRAPPSDPSSAGAGAG